MRDSKPVPLTFTEKPAEARPVSDIFVVPGASADDSGISRLVGLMAGHDTPFYETQAARKGLLARDDTVIIKVNSQWEERGGTNTDLVKALIGAITRHPEGFTGEIVVADNGQAQYGSTGRGGGFDYTRNNAQDVTQSVQKVADSFSAYRVSTSLWDRFTTHRVAEYAEGNDEDGYVIAGGANPRTGIIVSYPKFKTKFGTRISFKMGVWRPETQSYDSGRLKVINVPVLKSHMIYGVTACIKHYMGVTSDKLTSRLGASSHASIGAGGLGTEMAETRFPALNIVDALWVNATPGRGPGTSYESASRADIIAASTDPVALDCWAAKNVLIPAARHLGYDDVTAIDPDSQSGRSFGRWLRLSQEELVRAGHPATTDEAHISVHIAPAAQ